ncbi:MAG: FGGY family carbohydrate kinase, partial [Candidatus Bathyarchaeota archaeon]|nr:FGGY family carbohydrate kinase [Candidatus Bathyarchaeota archaeon]
IGVDGISNSPILVDERLEFLRPCILWMDERGAEHVPTVLRSLEAEGITPALPITPLITLAKLLWIRDKEPDLWRNTYRVLQPKDYVRMWLAGNVATDPSDASVTMMFDGKTFRWADYVERIFSIEMKKLPEIVPSYKVTGYLTRKAAEQTGLREGTPVVTGCADGVADVLAAGITENFDSLIRLGTAGVFSAVLDKYLPNKEKYYIFAHAVPDKWVIQRIFPFGLPHKWFLKTFCSRELEYAESMGLDPYTYVENALSNNIKGMEEETGELIFIPNMKIFEEPSRFLGAFIGIKSLHTRSHLMLALFRGLACAVKEAIDLVSQNLDFTINRIRLIGGGSRSALMRKTIATLLNVKVETVKHHDASIGSAILSGIGIKAYKSPEEAFRKIIKLDLIIEPDKRSQIHLLKIHETYLRIRKAFEHLESSKDKVD